ncbi:thymine dioxygenase [Mycena pura]|uniref:Thymine dioxygenase n=1 Tax=Mycena pura TaxID=153505 RepID=A0AAD6VNM9_9AGAR|nr:thymine dioxygenase [Mycena pura]
MPTSLLPDSDIAVVDFAGFLDGSNRQAPVADEILDSLKRVGFVYLLNYGLAPDWVDGMFAESKSFFALPLELKELAPHPPSGAHHRGYSSLGREKIVQPTPDGNTPSRLTGDVKESFECGHEDNATSPNIWLPDDVLPGFKERFLEVYAVRTFLLRFATLHTHERYMIQRFHQVELDIFRALAIAFRLPEDYFTQYHSGVYNQLRLLHYPPVSAEALRRGDVERITAHSDYGSITLLLQDAAGGLEIENPHRPGEFQPVPPVPGALIVNAADLLMRWSNDTIRSAVHRVRAPACGAAQDGLLPDRYSIPYDFDKIIECVPGTWDAQRPRKYAPVTSGEYINTRYAAAY